MWEGSLGRETSLCGSISWEDSLKRSILRLSANEASLRFTKPHRYSSGSQGNAFHLMLTCETSQTPLKNSLLASSQAHYYFIIIYGFLGQQVPAHSSGSKRQLSFRLYFSHKMNRAHLYGKCSLSETGDIGSMCGGWSRGARDVPYLRPNHNPPIHPLTSITYAELSSTSLLHIICLMLPSPALVNTLCLCPYGSSWLPSVCLANSCTSPTL